MKPRPGTVIVNCCSAASLDNPLDSLSLREDIYMWKARRVRRAHADFLRACRTLRTSSDYWSSLGPVKRWILQTLVPAPLLGLDDSGRPILEALEWLEENCKKQAITEELVKHYHVILSKGGIANAGSYRHHPMRIPQSATARPEAVRIAPLMKQLNSELLRTQEEFDRTPPDHDTAMRAAMKAHQRIAFIHPFSDGNGRVARLSMNHLLRRYDQGYVILPPVDESREHWDVLEKAHQGDLEPLIAFARKHQTRP